MFPTPRPNKIVAGFLLPVMSTFTFMIIAISHATAAGQEPRQQRFDYLSTHGNSNCTTQFQASITTMPAISRLQGSCCAPMVLDRYIAQVNGLKKYATYLDIPPDPYDIPAGLAQKAMANYGAKLNPTQQAAYQYAMSHSTEHGPCCCHCWRWQAYGGLGKYLIQHEGFTGPQVAEVWDLSDGCGGQN